MGLKCLFITLKFCYTATGHEESPDLTTLPCTAGLSSFTIPQGKLLIHSHTVWFSDELPLSLLTAEQLCRTQGRGKGISHGSFCCPIKHKVVSSKRLWISTHIFWWRIVAVWAILLTLCNFKLLHKHIWGGGSVTVDIHRSRRVSATRRN